MQSTPMRFAGPLLVVLAAGCLSPQPPADFRYFTPYVPEPAAAMDAGGGAASLEMPLIRVRRVSAANHLRENMAWRSSEQEMGFYYEWKWTEIPSEYLKRSVERVFFQERGYRRTESVLGPSLDLELRAFEDLLASPRKARVSLHVYLLNRDQVVLLAQTFTADHPVAADDPLEVALALGRALDQVVKEAARAVGAALRTGS